MNRVHDDKKILLVGWDAADWKFINPLLDSGLLPNLSNLVDSGVIANLASLKPCLSPILWTSIATGKTADKHGILGFIEPVPGGGGVQLSTSTSRKTKAIWNILSQNNLNNLVVNWYASHPAEPIQGVAVSNLFFDKPSADRQAEWSVPSESVQPPEKLAGLSSLRMHPTEWNVKDLERFVPDINSIDLSSDPRPSLLAEELAKTVSIHSVATHLLESEEWQFAAVYYDAIDTIGHHFMSYHPPQLPSVSGTDFQLYQSVMREVYLFHDEMLGRLLELAGNDTTVILLSDHGFQSGSLRPQQIQQGSEVAEDGADWHRPYGVLAMRGNELLEDERIYGATLLDIVPTVLTLFDLPIGQDMDGRPLLQAFKSPASTIETTDSWDSVHGNDGRFAANIRHSMTQSPEAIAQLVALGYLPRESTESQLAIDSAMAESKFNLAIVHSYHRRPMVALQLFEELYSQHPDNIRYAIAVAKTAANLKEHKKSLRVIGELQAKGVAPMELKLIKTAELFNLGRTEESLELLREIEGTEKPGLAVYHLVGKIRLAQGDWKLAFEAFANALKLNDEDPHVLQGLALSANKLGDFDNAAEYALQAISLLYYFPQAHFQLGLSFEGLGDISRAIRSIDLAVSQAPGFLEAHKKLASLYQRINNIPLALNHRRLSDGLPPLM